ncbi:MAG TPA: DNA cytosine methyltransferase [Candidatus Nanoarchaeia archaeon]|nr:DNA cytosine methyltransferase [Candidatus Nanoarchaeia archaeon]
MSKKEYKIVSLFSGCGGMDKGFEGGFTFLNKTFPKHNFKTVFMNDIMKQACETCKLNFQESEVICGDIKKVISETPEDIPRNVDVIIGGFPCQDFSVAGKRGGLKTERGRLYQQMKKVIELVKPKIFVAENVKGLTNLGNAIETIISDFANSTPSYQVNYKLLMAADYGISQSRERVFIIGIREDFIKRISKKTKFKFNFPEPTHSMINSKLPQWINVRETIKDLEESKIDRQNELSRAKNYGTHLQGNRSIDPNKVGPTIRAEHHGNIEFHYNKKRRLTVRECARIQSFPDDYKFWGSTSNVYVQIGNAVPPVLAWHIAESIKEILDKDDQN